ncbi:unnamed protein product [Spirodela intermedia]|uniref:Uncharacterized protein n=1 Tax=Spirodela intermedia TaxID=51605 RepID=A0A7I8IK40_SPIIN|nr:unnamed protein product [Spirodela intermedia]CAA6658252.1 unnamed protein product [Spirodela intermedia]
MDLADLFLLFVGALLAVFWWRYCGSNAGGGGGGEKTKSLPPGPRGAPPVHIRCPGSPSQVRPHLQHEDGPANLIIVTSSELIHEALVQRGHLFASRPADSPTRLLFSVGKCTVNSAFYGPLWRALRRNFVSEIVSPAKNHLVRLRREQQDKGSVQVMDNCRLTICSILVCICFGARVAESLVQQIEAVLKEVMMMSTLKLPDFLPALTPLFRGQLTAARNSASASSRCSHRCKYTGEAEMVSPIGGAYIDSLFVLNPAGRGRLGEDELVTLCSEVMSAGTDTSATALEWALLHMKITETEVEKMPYLTAVVKETLRRHPPSHFVLSHAATEDTELGGYRVPAGANVEFYTAWLTENPEMWEDPGRDGWETDVTGMRGVRMMPFGVGRRICPAASLGTLHVQMMLARMVREFRWVSVPGEGPPDPEETFAFTVVMKEPLRAAIVERKY